MTTILLPVDGGAGAPPAGTLDWPTHAALRPSGSTIGVRPAASAWQAVYTRQRQAVSHLADRMTASLSFAPCLAQHAGYREAFIDHLAERSPWVRLHHFARPAPLGTLRGSPTVVADVAAGERSITLAGGTAGANLLRNSSFEYGSPLSGSWVAYTLGTVAGVSYVKSTGAVHGTATQYVGATSLGTTAGDRNGLTQDVTLPADVSGPVAASIYARGTLGSRIALYLYAFDSVGAFISGAQLADAALSDAAELQRYSGTWTLPAGTRTIRFFVWHHSMPSLGAGSMGLDAAQLELAGAATAYTGPRTLLGGDMLGVGGRLLKVAYTGAEESAAGLVVPLALPLRTAVTAGAAVTWDKPTGTFQVESTADVQYAPGIVQQGFDLSFLEVV